MRIWLKRIGIVCLIPVVLVLLVSVLLYIPPVQNFAVKKAAYYAGKATGMQIGIERIRLSFPLNLTVRGVEVLTTPADTLLTLKSLTVNVRALPLLKKEVLVDAIDLEGVKVNTGTFIEGMEIKGVLGRLYAKADRINLSKEKVTFNTIDLSDTAITLLLNDTTTKADTTSTAVNWILNLQKINLDRVAFAMQMPADSLRLSTYIDKANLKDGIVDLGASHYGADLFTLTGYPRIRCRLSGSGCRFRSFTYRFKQRHDLARFAFLRRTGYQGAYPRTVCRGPFGTDYFVADR